MMRVMVAAVVVFAFLLGGCNQPKKFEQSAFSDAGSVEKEASTYWKREGWWGGLPPTVKKVAITQFCVEYVTENTSKSGADAISVLGAMEMAGMGKRKREFNEDFKAEFPTELYQQFVKAFESQGYEVVPMQTITGNPAFAQLKAATNGQTHSWGKGNESAKVQTYAVKGLPIPDNGFLNLGAGDVFRAEYKVIGDSGAQAGLRVHIRVALDDDGRAVLGGGSTIHASYDFEKQNWRPNEPGEWVSKQRGQLTSQGSMRDDVPVISSKEFKAFQGDVYTVDSERYRQSVDKMYPTYARMAAIKIKG